MSEQKQEKTLAVISAGGKQHLAGLGEKFIINQISQAEGSTFSAVNELDQSPVQLKVVKHFLGEKIRGLKFKNKVRYLKRYGHRQHLSVLEVVALGDSKKAEPKPAVAKAATPKKVATKKPSSKAAPKVKNV